MTKKAEPIREELEQGKSPIKEGGMMAEKNKQPQYHLVCENCGSLFWSDEGFPDPCWCSDCKTKTASKPTPDLPEEQVIEELQDYIEARLEMTYAYGLSALDWDRKAVAQQIIAKLHSLGCRSPSEVRELERSIGGKEIQRLIAAAELRNPGKYNASRERYLAEISFKSGERKAVERVVKKIDDLIIGTTAPFEKRMTEGCVILDMNLPQWEALKSKLLEQGKG